MNKCIPAITQLYILVPIVIHIYNKYPSFILSLMLLLKVGMGDGGEQTCTKYCIVVS
jgi:hypothetical protein